MMLQPIIDLFHLRGGKKVHRYPTRNKHLPNIQPHPSVMFNNSFLCKSLSVYNNLPGITKRAINLKAFMHKAKEKFIY